MDEGEIVPARRRGFDDVRRSGDPPLEQRGMDVMVLGGRKDVRPEVEVIPRGVDDRRQGAARAVYVVVSCSAGNAAF